jgi:cell division protein FtsL
MRLNDFLFSKSNYEFDTILKNSVIWIRKNRWKLFLIIFISAIFIIAMVSNVKTINRQLSKVRKLEHELNSLSNKNIILQSHISELESPERIINIATEKLKMTINTNLPKTIKKYNE